MSLRCCHRGVACLHRWATRGPGAQGPGLAPGARAQGAWWESFASWQSLTRERVALPVSGSCLGRGFWRRPLSCRRGQWEGSSGVKEGEAVSGAQGASCPHPGRGPSRVLAGQPGRDLGPGSGSSCPWVKLTQGHSPPVGAVQEFPSPVNSFSELFTCF